MTVPSCLNFYLAEFLTGWAHECTFMKPSIWDDANRQLLPWEITCIRVVCYLQQMGYFMVTEVHIPNIKPWRHKSQCYTFNLCTVVKQKLCQSHQEKNEAKTILIVIHFLGQFFHYTSYQPHPPTPVQVCNWNFSKTYIYIYKNLWGISRAWKPIYIRNVSAGVQKNRQSHKHAGG
jgi:hypothetical protein